MTGLKESIESHLRSLFASPENPLFSGANYSLFAPSKRLRPILTLTTGIMLGSFEEALLPSACALELVHTYSIIHDDLPCMDDDDFRRGKPSLHKATSEAEAVLVGDFLLTHAFALIANAPHLSDNQKVTLIQLLSAQGGGQGMVLGQLMDIASEGKKISLSTLKKMHAKKTGALIETAVAFGAIIANASQETTRLLRQFGQTFGLLFQVVDDILDVTKSQEKRGCQQSSDLKNHKSTYVSHLGLQGAQQEAFRLKDTALKHLHALPFATAPLEALVQNTINHIA